MAWYWPFKRAESAPLESTETAILKAGPESFTTNASVPGPTKPAGADGVAVTSGFIVSGERNPALTGRNKWVTYDNATLNVAIVSAAVNVWTQLAGSAKWTAEPNKRGGAKAKRAADILTEGLLEAQMSIPWRAIVRRQVMKKFRGFALHEMVIRRRSDGMVVCADLGDRPQWTIYRWDIPDDRTPWQGVEQMTQFGKTYYIPRERLLYSVENTLSATPDGVGLLRQLAEHVRVLELYQQWEGIGFQTDLRGVPVARAPLQALRKMIDPGGVKTESEVRAGIQGATKFLTDFLMAHNKRADQGIMLDSGTFPDVQGNPTGTAQWAFELVQGSGGSMSEVGVAIGRLTREIARVMQAEWLMLGGEDSGGAYSMHEDKTAMFALIVNSALDDVADDATRDCATRLTALNGLDPETCTPRLVPEPIATSAVQAACQSLATLFTAGLDPRDPAINVLRGRLNLPPAPPPDEAMLALQRSGAQGGGLPPEIGGGAPVTPAPDDPQGEAGNPNARPDAEPEVKASGQPKIRKFGKSKIRKFDEDQPRADDGKWTSGGGGGGGPDPGRTPDDRAAASVKGLIAEHRERLIGAADKIRANYPRELHATDAVHEEAQKELRAEAGRILREQAVVGNDPRLKAALENARDDKETTGEQAEKEHDALIAHVAERGAELAQHDEARAAGLVPKVPDDELKAYSAAEAQHAPALDAAHAEVDAASQKALDALGKYGAHAGEDAHDVYDVYGDSDPEEVAAIYASAADRLGGKGELDIDGDFTGDRPSQEHYTHLVDSDQHESPEKPDIPDHFRDEETGEMKKTWEPDPDWEPESVTHEEASKLDFSDDDSKRIEPWDPERFNGEHGEHLDPDELLGEMDARGHVSSDFDPSDYEPGVITAEQHAAMVDAWNRAADADRTEYERIADKWKAEEKAHEAADKANFARVKAELAARDELKRKAADDAQAALEDLHAKQLVALQQTKSIEKALKKHLHAAHEEVDEDDFDPAEHAHDHIVEHPALAAAVPTDEDDERMFEGDQHERLYHGAQGAFAEDVATARRARKTLGYRHGEHTQDDLKEALATTTDMVKALAKISGRSPKLSKPTKKSVAKFDDGQPRAPDGKWTSGGGSGGSGSDSAGASDQSSNVESAGRRATIATASANGGFHPDVQKVIREQVSSELKQFGMHPNQAGESGSGQHVVTVLSDAQLAATGAVASMNQTTGEMKLSQSFATALQHFYASKPEDIVRQLEGGGVKHALTYGADHPGRDAAMASFAHAIVVHEQIHASGPQLGYFKYGAALEEVATEMSARHVHAATLGVDSRDVRGAYNQLIYRNVIGLQKTAGVDARTAYAALEHASLSWKRQPDDGTERVPEKALKFMAEHALRHVGVHDDSKTAELSGHMVQAWKDEVKANRM